MFEIGKTYKTRGGGTGQPLKIEDRGQFPIQVLLLIPEGHYFLAWATKDGEMFCADMPHDNDLMLPAIGLSAGTNPLEPSMNLSGMTPAEQVRALGLAVGDTIEGTEDSGHRVRLQLLGYVRCKPVWEHWFMMSGQWVWKNEGIGWALETVGDWRIVASDSAMDPAAPLRAEIARACDLFQTLLIHHSMLIKPEVKAWLDRNAAFAPSPEETRP